MRWVVRAIGRPRSRLHGFVAGLLCSLWRCTGCGIQFARPASHASPDGGHLGGAACRRPEGPARRSVGRSAPVAALPAACHTANADRDQCGHARFFSLQADAEALGVSWSFCDDCGRYCASYRLRRASGRGPGMGHAHLVRLVRSTCLHSRLGSAERPIWRGRLSPSRFSHVIQLRNRQYWRQHGEQQLRSKSKCHHHQA
ncbi:hypothetical protein SAMN05428969_1033 [Devosia sp. YR412]|nr:hypothetical protein SAMN05428969_1033 [Devosia sp. YR412]